jgi:lipopolysaccharide transport system ATP-binding protein
MSSEPAIAIRGVGKHYEIYDKPQHRLWQSVFRGKRQFYREFWALRGVNFDIQRGETFGIVGRNGSGKSTLLQIVAGTLQPTTGEVRVHGRVAALLELGSGFNPEFTGRENVFLNAAMLGLSRGEIEARYDDIVAFSEIGDFMDQPVKTYSSGMYVRLAFSVSINVDPDILIVDEALSVGDEAFQRKCYARIRTIRDSGATILFVSHACAIVLELCDRAVLLDHGEQLLLGAPKPVISYYQKLMFAPPEVAARLREDFRAMDTQTLASQTAVDASGSNSTPEFQAGVAATASSLVPVTPADPTPSPSERFDPNLVPKSTIVYPSRGSRIENPRITRLDGSPVNILRRRREYEYRYDVHFDQTAQRVRFCMLIKSVTGLELGGFATPLGQEVPIIRAGSVLEVAMRFRCTLAPGVYFNNAGILGEDATGVEQYLARMIDAVMFRVEPEARSSLTATMDFLIEARYTAVQEAL